MDRRSRLAPLATLRSGGRTAAILVAALGLSVSPLAAGPAAAATPTTAGSIGNESFERVIVRYDPAHVGAVEQAIARLGGKGVQRLAAVNAITAVVPAHAVAVLRMGAGVLAVTEDGKVRLTGDKWRADGDANSLSFIAQATGATTVWGKSDLDGNKITGKGIGVALIDSGIAPVTGLSSTKVINGPDLSFESQAPNLRFLDTYGHGTHMAGIIAGRDSGIKDTDLPKTTSFVGMAPDANLINMKVAAADGATDVSQVIAAIDWVVVHRNDPGLNIRVLNLSFGTDSTQDPRLDPLSHAVEAAWRNGIVVVVAAGNDGAAATRLAMPAANPYVISVGAADPQGTQVRVDDTVADFSSRGNITRHPDLVATGKSVVSLRNPGSYIDVNYPGGLVPGDTTGRFFRGSGTSQATAVVSGAAALLLQQRPTLTPDQVKRLLMTTADPMPLADPVAAGSGQLNVAAASKAPTPLYAQTFAPSLGTGSLELSRGSSHVADPVNGVALTGEQDIMGNAWNPVTWSAAALAGCTWSGGIWNGATWSGGDWTGVSWTGRTWSGATWSGATWSGATWSGHIWSGATWSGSTWSGATWSGATWSGATWSGSTWSGTNWLGSTWQ